MRLFHVKLFRHPSTPSLFTARRSIPFHVKHQRGERSMALAWMATRGGRPIVRVNSTRWHTILEVDSAMAISTPCLHVNRLSPRHGTTYGLRGGDFPECRWMVLNVPGPIAAWMPPEGLAAGQPDSRTPTMGAPPVISVYPMNFRL
jgi:hypothetical protein